MAQVISHFLQCLYIYIYIYLCVPIIVFVSAEKFGSIRSIVKEAQVENAQNRGSLSIDCSYKVDSGDFVNFMCTFFYIYSATYFVTMVFNFYIRERRLQCF